MKSVSLQHPGWAAGRSVRAPSPFVRRQLHLNLSSSELLLLWDHRSPFSLVPRALNNEDLLLQDPTRVLG
jgi:hypothetical protein